MNFPVVVFPGLGGPLLIAIIGIVHVLVSHGIAAGGGFFLVLLERKSIRESDERLNQLTYYLARWFFIIATSVGALTGVGIWFSTNIFSPVAIGSLLRVFFWVWFFEWCIFVTELALVSVYYLTWKLMAPQRHLRVGVLYVIVSMFTIISICGILAYMLTSGRWPEDHTLASAFFNPTFLPQMCSRIALAALLACTFSLFIFLCLPSLRDVRERFVRFCGAYLIVVSPVYLFFTYTYYETLPAHAMKIMPVALTTLKFTQYVVWSEAFYFAVAVLLLVIGAVLFFARRTYFVLSIFPVLLLSAGVVQFERVREFVRRPYVIADYVYSNGILKDEAPYLSSVGVTKYFTWPWRGLDQSKGDTALGNAVFLIECRACHTYRGVNGIFNKGAIVGTEDTAYQFLTNIQTAYPYMPPFIGTDEEKRALAKFLSEGNSKK